MLIQSDYHIHASFYRIKKPTDIPGPTAAEQIAAAREAGSVYVGIVEHCNTAAKHPFSCLKDLAAEYYSPGFSRENVFLGVESDLSPDGSDHCGCAGRKELDLHYVIGSVHCSPSSIPDLRDYFDFEYRCITNALPFPADPFSERVAYNVDIVIGRQGIGYTPVFKVKVIPEIRN